MKGRDYSLNGVQSPEVIGDDACQSSKVRNIPEHLDPKSWPEGCLILVESYRKGDLLKWPVLREPPKPPLERERAGIQQSVKSRLNAAFKLGNAETDWLAMATLTYRVAPDSYESVKADWIKFKDRLRKKWAGTEWAWILEFQSRGAAHFHVFLGDSGELGKALSKEKTKKKKRKDSETEIFVGEVANWFSSTWIDVVGDTDPRFLKFQRGGILEKMRSKDAAGRYAAKEAAKRVQKCAPWPVSQWWGMSSNIRPKWRSSSTMTVKEFMEKFPDMPACSRLWEHVK